MKLFIDEINEVVKNAFEELGYERETGRVNVSNRPDLCQYQCNGALANAKKHKKAPMIIAQEVVEKLKDNKIFSKLEAVAPGFIKTPMTDKLTDAQREAMLAQIAMKRYGEVEEIAGVVSFLASKDASYVTGQVIEISGGLMM